MGCELKMDIPAKYTIVKSEQQDEEYAEYPGELSSFVLEATLDLPNGCKKNRQNLLPVPLQPVRRALLQP
jgi:hypothetical protein